MKNSSFVFLTLIRHTVSVRSRSVKGASHQPVFMGSRLTINHTCFPYLSSRQVRKCSCVTQGREGGGPQESSTRDLRVGLYSLVFVEGL